MIVKISLFYQSIRVSYLCMLRDFQLMICSPRSDSEKRILSSHYPIFDIPIYPITASRFLEYFTSFIPKQNKLKRNFHKYKNIFRYIIVIFM